MFNIHIISFLLQCVLVYREIDSIKFIYISSFCAFSLCNLCVLLTLLFFILYTHMYERKRCFMDTRVFFQRERGEERVISAPSLKKIITLCGCVCVKKTMNYNFIFHTTLKPWTVYSSKVLCFIHILPTWRPACNCHTCQTWFLNNKIHILAQKVI